MQPDLKMKPTCPALSLCMVTVRWKGLSRRTREHSNYNHSAYWIRGWKWAQTLSSCLKPYIARVFFLPVNRQFTRKLLVWKDTHHFRKTQSSFQSGVLCRLGCTVCWMYQQREPESQVWTAHKKNCKVIPSILQLRIIQNSFPGLVHWNRLCIGFFITPCIHIFSQLALRSMWCIWYMFWLFIKTS